MKKIITRENGTRRVMTINELPSKTDPSQADDCDINNIMRKFRKTGQVTHLNNANGFFADVSEMTNLHEAMIKAKNAEDAFLLYPADLRKKFNNNYANLVTFLNDPSNDEDAIELGLKIKTGSFDKTTGNNRQGVSPQKTKKNKSNPPPNDDEPNDDE